jgi:hypothetical protein
MGWAHPFHAMRVGIEEGIVDKDHGGLSPLGQKNLSLAFQCSF